jgi:hypothetical protein
VNESRRMMRISVNRTKSTMKFDGAFVRLKDKRILTYKNKLETVMI